MKTYILTFVPAFALAVSSTALSAASHSMDTDGDGAYSFNELLAAYPTLTEETYQSIDADADGLINEEELTAAKESGVLPS